MQPLKDHIILYDEECPMCRLYTNAFVKSGLLEQNGRACYQNIPNSTMQSVDRQRAADEIALVNRRTGEVKYGIYSLFTVIAHAFPVFRTLFSWSPFVWIMSLVYAFISYNRRVIVPPSGTTAPGIQPSFKLSYRLAYLLLTWLATSAILSHYTPLLNGLLPSGTAYREYLVCGGQILFQGLVASIFLFRKRWAYLGNMMTISFAGALLLLPAFLLTHYVHTPVFYTIYFLAVAGMMFLEHIRRTGLLQLGVTLTFTWVAYRIIILFIILYTR